MNVVECLLEHARSRADSPAIIDICCDRERRVSFADLDSASARAAALLHGRGLRQGDAVLVFLPMSVDLYVLLIALFRLGLVAMFVDPQAGLRHIESCCRLHPPRGFVGSTRAHLMRIVSRTVRRIPLKFTTGRTPRATRLYRATDVAPYSELFTAKPETPALVTFTSGSSGEPKAAIRSHGLLLAQHAALARALALTPGTLDLTTLPIFVLANLASGVTSLIADADLRYPSRIDPERVIRQIRRYKPTSTVASPAFLERIAQHADLSGEPLPEFKRIFAGGAPVFPNLLDALHATCPEAEICAVYGSTEAEPIAQIARHEIGSADVSAMMSGAGLLTGRPVEEVELRIIWDQWGHSIDPLSMDEFAKTHMPRGEPGEIVVSGAHVLPSYLHGLGDEESKFTVAGTRWHRTGDAGYLDERGRLWLLGRCAARVEDSHGRTYPFAVECAAQDHSSVRRAAFVSLRGKRVLVLECRDGSASDNVSGLRKALSWAHLERIEVVRKIPVDRRHNAKIDYPALKKKLGM